MTRMTTLLATLGLAVSLGACGDNERLNPQPLLPQDNNRGLESGDLPPAALPPGEVFAEPITFAPELGTACADTATCFEQVTFCPSGNAVAQTSEGATLENLTYGVTEDEIWTISETDSFEFTYKPDGTVVGPFGNILVDVGIDINVCDATTVPQLSDNEFVDPNDQVLEQTLEGYIGSELGTLDFDFTVREGYEYRGAGDTGTDTAITEGHDRLDGLGIQSL